MQFESAKRGRRRAIQAVGILLGLYLAALIAFGYFGQQSLRGTLVEQEQLSIERQATAIGYFLASQQAVIDEFAASESPLRFLRSHERGLPGDDTARRKAAALRGDFEALLGSKTVAGRPVFNHIALVTRDGRNLIEARSDSGTGHSDRYRVRPQVTPGDLVIERRDNQVLLTLTAPVNLQDRSGWYLAADMDAALVLRPLLAGTGRTAPRWRTALIDPDGRVIATSNGHDRESWRTPTALQRNSAISANVAGQRFRIVSFPDLDLTQGVLTSPLFLAALAFLSVPLLGGVVYLLRLNEHNLLLRSGFLATRQQRAELRQQNHRLQREINKRTESEQQLAHQANYDQLTGLPNRNLAIDRLAQALKRAKRDGGIVLVMFIDLDRFKQVNDSLGHAAGDELLREASQRLQAQVRDSDTVSRLGGDEFLVICPEPLQHEGWEKLAKRILKTLSQPFYVGDHEFFVGGSIGVASYPEGGGVPQRLVKNADIAMYAAKALGRNRYCYYDPSMDADAMETVKLENSLRHALARNEFQLVFQPIVDLSSGRTIAVEALLRWHSRELGEIPPERFLPVAEETGLIHELGEWVLLEACRQIGTLHPERDFRVTVNLSAKQFSRPGPLLDCVLQALRESGLMPSQLELEITESVLIDDRPEIGEFINQLDRIGVRLAIDDFGTGYSALNYLQRFPFDVLKIDRSLTSDIPDNGANAASIRAMIAMAHALDLEVIAEGVENRSQAGFLLVHHCELGQGFLYSKPVDVPTLREHLALEPALTA